MSLTGYSHASVVRWAKQNFRTDFEQLPGARDIAVHLVIGTGKNERGDQIGILAWLEGGRMILGYVTKVGNGVQDTCFDSLESMVHNANKIKKLFCWTLEASEQTAAGKLEALVRYFFLLKGSTQAVMGNFQDFEMCFPGACRGVAAARGVGLGGEEVKDSTRRSDLCSESVATRPSPTPLYAFEIFVGSLDASPKNPSSGPRDSAELISTQDDSALYRENYEADLRILRSRVQDLSERLVSSESRLKKAENEAMLWKGHCEQLRRKVEEDGGGDGSRIVVRVPLNGES
ncbi:hypothetical protein EK21DRAFT_109689 [Setomelanomma holmii]|uniref:Uncharacterized protein n=1 Tax=Setomelanomma holmii TaxID=210430 RepID=A0A9P4HG16_9PLEO|nr:hypothetical protein EK21DRAFT_109689 [Setomelanomma holmii]